VKDEPEVPAAGVPAPPPIDRRELLRRAGSVTVAAGFAISAAAVEAAHEHVA